MMTDARGRWGFWALAAFLAVAYVANITSPPSQFAGTSMR